MPSHSTYSASTPPPFLPHFLYPFLPPTSSPYINMISLLPLHHNSSLSTLRMDTTLHILDEDAEELQEEPTACAFCCFPFFGRRRHAGLEHRSLLPAEATGGWEDQSPAREPKGLSPKRVALFRRIICHSGGGIRTRRTAPQFQYDLASYALNFDDGAGHLNDAPAADRPFLGFSSSKDSYDDIHET